MDIIIFNQFQFLEFLKFLIRISSEFYLTSVLIVTILGELIESKYNPELNKSMADFAEHYDIAVLPTRVRKPKDKALVESAVYIFYTRIYAPLHDKVFHSLRELNEAIRSLLDKHNNAMYQQKPFSRKQRFDSIERDQLKSLWI